MANFQFKQNNANVSKIFKSPLISLYRLGLYGYYYFGRLVCCTIATFYYGNCGPPKKKGWASLVQLKYYI